MNSQLGLECDITIDKLLKNLQNQGVCQDILPNGQLCSAPLKEGVYFDNYGPVEYDIEFIPSQITKIEALKLQGTLSTTSETTVACLSTIIEVTFNKNYGNVLISNYNLMRLCCLLLLLNKWLLSYFFCANTLIREGMKKDTDTV